MNEFNKEIDKAKTQQRQFYVVTACLVTVVAATLFLLMVKMWVITIEVIPEEARLNQTIGLNEGLGFVIGSKLYSISDKALVSVASKGFYTVNKEVPENSDGPLLIQLTPLPGKVIATTEIAEESTHWFVDGKLKSIGAGLSVEVEAGAHEITAENPFYEPSTQSISLNRGETKHARLKLNPIVGSLALSSSPLGAEVSINGKSIGKTPITKRMLGGAYNIEIGLPKYETIVEKIRITNKKLELSRNYKLQLERGFVSIIANPPGGVLLLNGKKVSAGQSLSVTAFKNNISTYHKKGYFAGTVNFRVESSEEKEIVFKLKPETGIVKLISHPAANVLINGRPYGLTPLEIKLPAVQHRVEFKLNGYESVEQTITPSSSELKKLDVKLQSEKELALSQAKENYVHESGIELKLFRPNKISMGSPRHESGQLANEFQRKVVLNKAFYVGKYEVTNEQYLKFQKGKGVANLPITNISWIEAVSFCNWLSKVDGVKEPFYEFKGGQYVGFNASSTGYRLLSEAEWEWLARKSGKNKQTVFTWGNRPVIPTGVANLSNVLSGSGIRFESNNPGDGFSSVSPAGSFKANRDGIFDLDGNVREWVHDFYSLIPPRNDNLSEYNPLGDMLGYKHVVKGAGWRSGTLTNLRASYRDSAFDGKDDIGFRVARYLH
ncbi:MAG: hypothetical protein A6F72_01565 [Cycloclasticus sp. symbiont of Poecilosclerida sp. N]|nr:MAG: hypothetical protein A6F72_01565 [Cycloclasticus sp. symbiont of Poecilosclerida sp. N]